MPRGPNGERRSEDLNEMLKEVMELGTGEKREPRPPVRERKTRGGFPEGLGASPRRGPTVDSL